MMNYLMKLRSGQHANKLGEVTFIFLDMEWVGHRNMRLCDQICGLPVEWIKWDDGADRRIEREHG